MRSDGRARLLAITRPFGKGEETTDYVRQLGWNSLIVHSVQLIHRDPSDLFSDLREIISEGLIDWMVFMSPEGVHRIFEVLRTHGNLLPSLLGKFRVVAVGPTTRDAVMKQGLREVEMPIEFSSRGIAKLLAGYSLDQKRVVLVRSADADSFLDRALASNGARVVTIPVYSSSQPRDITSVTLLIEHLQNRRVDAILFTSSRSVSNLFSIVEKTIGPGKLVDFLSSCIVGAIGPVTAQTLRDFNIQVDVLPEHSLVNEAAKSLTETWESKHSPELIRSAQ
ncbi:MAG TPA: uroporphyrinogen-III synthase [Candidatus Bathyarchaeia archaeon]|nr:uroporphyrinogen-III synthase [Candidatus Bathyarchaeia archaeon]